jgi:hypothetical protein
VPLFASTVGASVPGTIAPTDPFTLQYVAGHDNIKTTMRYVHPQANAVQALFMRLGGLESRQQAHRGTRRRVVTK